MAIHINAQLQAAKAAPQHDKDDGPWLGGWSGSWRHTFVAALRAIFVPDELSSSRNIAKYCPLIAAVIAPMSTLMDIPALSQHWYTYNGGPMPDPVACVVLSALGLALNVVANMLLVVRFSGTSIWRKGTTLSLFFWLGKTLVALVNLIYFGATTRNGDGFRYAEGFWCAVASITMSGIISVCLLFHYFFAFGHKDADQEDIRLTGRKFMISVTFFMILVGFQALAFNQLEHWAYLDAIYFSLQCAFTIGYGDLTAHTAAGKVLVFPFAVLTISQLANEVSLIVDFVRKRSQDKRDHWRKRYSVAMHREAIKRKPYATLIDEMSLIHQINLHQETMIQLYDLFWSGLTLLLFWLVGGLVFHYVEFWGFGNCLYAVMVLSLTIGFGDFCPVTPGGRVFWICYAMMAVPIVTNFAVQTVTGIMHTWSEHRFTRSRFEMERERDPEVFAPHSHFILRHHEQWDPTRHEYLATKVDSPIKIKMDPNWGANAPVPKPRGKNGGNGADNNVGKNARKDSAGSKLSLASLASKVSKFSTASKYSTASSNGRASPNGKASMNGDTGRLSESKAKTKPKEMETVEEHEVSDEELDQKNETAEDRVVAEMLSDNDAHSDVVEALGAPDMDDSMETAQADDSGDPVKALQDYVAKTRSSPSPLSTVRTTSTPDHDPSDDADDEGGGDDGVDDDEADEIAKAEAAADPNMDSPQSGGSPRRQSLDKPKPTTLKHEKPVPHQPACGPRLIMPDRDTENNAHHLELNLIKELVDRITRLEAQGRQMLIDTMDQDLARTLLLADRNLQIRDAFQLYGDNIDLNKTFKEEAEKTRKDHKKNNEFERQAHILDTDGAEDDDMLTRVRRYRNTFAEILVLSSTLLKLEGDDLKRFERWHVGDLHHSKRRNLHEDPQRPKGSRLRRLSDWSKGRKTPYRPRKDPEKAEPEVKNETQHHRNFTHHHRKKGFPSVPTDATNDSEAPSSALGTSSAALLPKSDTTGTSTTGSGPPAAPQASDRSKHVHVTLPADPNDTRGEANPNPNPISPTQHPFRRAVWHHMSSNLLGDADKEAGEVKVSGMSKVKHLASSKNPKEKQTWESLRKEWDHDREILRKHVELNHHTRARMKQREGQAEEDEEEEEEGEVGEDASTESESRPPTPPRRSRRFSAGGGLLRD